MQLEQRDLEAFGVGALESKLGFTIFQFETPEHDEANVMLLQQLSMLRQMLFGGGVNNNYFVKGLFEKTLELENGEEKLSVFALTNLPWEKYQNLKTNIWLRPEQVENETF